MTDRPTDSTFDAADQRPGFLLWQITNRWQAAQRAALRPLGLTHVQFVLLAGLVGLGSRGPVHQCDLAEHASTDPMMTSQVVRALEARGLVARTEDPTDRRARLLVVTAAGRALANRAVAVVEQVDRTFFAPVGDLSDLVAALGRLRPGKRRAGGFSPDVPPEFHLGISHLVSGASGVADRLDQALARTPVPSSIPHREG